MRKNNFLWPLGLMIIVSCGSIFILPRLMSSLVSSRVFTSTDITRIQSSSRNSGLTHCVYRDVVVHFSNGVSIRAERMTFAFRPYELLRTTYTIVVTLEKVGYGEKQPVGSEGIETLVLEKVMVPLQRRGDDILIEEATVESSYGTAQGTLRIQHRENTINGEIQCVVYRKGLEQLPFMGAQAAEKIPEEYPISIRLSGNYRMPSIEVVSSQFTFALKGNE